MTNTDYPYGTGYNPPEVADERDWPLERLLFESDLDQVALPSEATLKGGLPYVFDQNGYGTCVADAFVGIKNFQEHLQTGQWLYDDISKTNNHSNSVDRFYLGGTHDSTYMQGWWIAAAMDYARRYGVIAKNGHRYLIDSYYTLLDGNNLETNIQKSIALLNRPVQFGFTWNTYWWFQADAENNYPHGILPPTPPPNVPNEAIWAFHVDMEIYYSL